MFSLEQHSSYGTRAGGQEQYGVGETNGKVRRAWLEETYWVVLFFSAGVGYRLW